MIGSPGIAGLVPYALAPYALASYGPAAPVLGVDNEDVGKAGPFGLFLILILLVAVFLLGRSMRTHLRRIPPTFDPPPGPAGGPLEGELLDAPERIPDPDPGLDGPDPTPGTRGAPSAG